jgi:hypothetical protein
MAISKLNVFSLNIYHWSCSYTRKTHIAGGTQSCLVHLANKTVCYELIESNEQNGKKDELFVPNSGIKLKFL